MGNVKLVLKDCNGQWIPNIENMEFLADNQVALLEALEKYSSHFKECNSLKDHTNEEVELGYATFDCDCGFEQAKELK